MRVSAFTHPRIIIKLNSLKGLKMSGIFLVVWDESKKDLSMPLHTTKGGYPHMTVAYTGENLPRIELIKVAQKLLNEWALEKVTLTKAYVNSFEDRPGHIRHDVLMEVDKSTEERIELNRRHMLTEVYSNSDAFFMKKVHVTHGIFETVQEAQDRVFWLNEDQLPLEVVVTGVTID